MSSRPPALAIAADVLADNEPVRRHVIASLNHRTIDVLLWRRHCWELEWEITPVGHRPSTAAHVFKAHAVAAAGTSAPIQMAAESFYSVT